MVRWDKFSCQRPAAGNIRHAVHGMAATLYLQSLEYILQMIFNGLFCDAQAFSDLLVFQSLRDAFHNLALARAELSPDTRGIRSHRVGFYLWTGMGRMPLDPLFQCMGKNKHGVAVVLHQTVPPKGAHPMRDGGARCHRIVGKELMFDASDPDRSVCHAGTHPFGEMSQRMGQALADGGIGEVRQAVPGLDQPRCQGLRKSDPHFGSGAHDLTKFIRGPRHRPSALKRYRYLGASRKLEHSRFPEDVVIGVNVENQPEIGSHILGDLNPAFNDEKHSSGLVASIVNHFTGAVVYHLRVGQIVEYVDAFVTKYWCHLVLCHLLLYSACLAIRQSPDGK